jgi:hypothetical protein
LSLKPRTILFAAWLAGALFACAQTSPPTEPAQPIQTPIQTSPLVAPTAPAEPAATAQDESGTSDEYQGPSIISRDRTLVGERGGKLLDFRVWAAISGVYDTGIVPVTTDTTGHISEVGGSEGIQASFGLSGTRQWQRDTLSIDYSGSYRHYFNNDAFDGTDQFLSLRLAHVISRHLTVEIRENGGTSNLANGAYTYLPLTAIDLQSTPTNQLFDNRTYYSQSRVGVTWKKSARLSFSLSGQGYLVRNGSSVLAGVNGYTGSADMAYRLTRRQTLSASYAYTSYDYQRAFGSATVQTVALGYAVGLGRRWDASFSLGGTQVQARGEQQVAVSPAIVAIIGVPTIETTFNTTVLVPYGAASIVRRFNHSAVSVAANTGISPGNGVYLTSKSTNASTSYSYIGLRRWTMGASFAFAELSSIGQAGLGKYDNYQAGFGATYRLGHQMHMELRYDYRHYTANNDFYLKDSQRITLGLAWSPGDVPLAIW